MAVAAMVEFVPALLTPGFSRSGRPLQPRGIVLHWTANLKQGADAMANRNWFESWRGYKVSSHYIVDDRRIVGCIPESEIAFGAGRATQPLGLALFGPTPNNHAIHIEWCVNAGSNGGETYKNAVALCGDILARYGWGVDRLLRHFDCTGKICPAMFVTDEWARKMGFQQGAVAAWSQFRRDCVIATRAAEWSLRKQGR
jgi:N-acetylmuramoyl-L-alanine amidase CwlA